MNSLVREALWWVKKVPVTTAVVGLILVVGVVTRSLWVPAGESGVIDAYGWGLATLSAGAWWNIVLGAFVIPVPWTALFILPTVAVGGGYLELKFGAPRMLAAFFVTHCAAVLIVCWVLSALTPLGVWWAVDLATVRDVGMSNAGVGAIGAGTAALERSWRQRVRSGLLLYVAAAVLFSGGLGDLTHFVGLLVGFAIGPLVVKRPYESPGFSFDTRARRNLVTQVVIFNLLSLVISNLARGQRGLLQLNATEPADATTAALVVIGTSFLGLMAYGLYAGRRIAWRITLLVTAAFVALLSVAWLVFGFDTAAGPFTLGINGALLVLLVIFRDSFRVVGDRLIRRTVYRNLALVAGGLFAVNALSIVLLRSNFSPEPDLGMAVVEAFLQIFGLSSGAFEPQTAAGHVLVEGISYLWLAAVLIALGVLVANTLRSRDGRGQFAEYDDLLHRSGTTSIGWMTRWEGMSFWLNAERTVGVGYRLENNFAVVLSDPIGAPSAVAAGIGSFLDLCERRGWHPVFYAVTDSFRQRAAELGFKSIIVAEDTVIELPGLAFTGKSWQSVRSAINQAGKRGITLQAIRLSDAPPEIADQLRAIAESWAGDKALPPLGFTLGTLHEALDPEVRLHLAVDPEGGVHGMTSWLPVYGDGQVVGWTLDIMQRRLTEDTMKGVVEFLIAASATLLKEEGYQFISLSASPLSRGEASPGPIEVVLDMIATRLEPFYGFASLHSFKAKFRPRFEPLYLCYADDAQLVGISVAITKAYLPDKAIRTAIGSTLT